MPSFQDSAVIFFIALILFGPKKLPELARQLGKLMGEFRRASNEFRVQMEDELRTSEQAEKQKQIAAMEAAAPLPPPLEEPEHPHLPSSNSTGSTENSDQNSTEYSNQDSTENSDQDSTENSTENSIAPPSMIQNVQDETELATAPEAPLAPAEAPATAPLAASEEPADGVRPIPIATSGDLRMMPPSTGLPTPRPRNTNPPESNVLGGLLDSIPEQPPPFEPAFARAADPVSEPIGEPILDQALTENAHHGD